MLVTDEGMRLHLTGFRSSLGYLLLTARGNTLFLDGRYMALASTCLLYTSDAADERSSVDLGGRRIVKKKKKKKSEWSQKQKKNIRKNKRQKEQI